MNGPTPGEGCSPGTSASAEPAASADAVARSGSTASAGPAASAESSASTGPAAVQLPRQWQFSIRSVMLATVIVSLLMAVIVRLAPEILGQYGPGGVVLAIAGMVMAANSAGWLKRWQTPQAKPRWFTAGWLIFFVSLACPAVKGCGSKPIYGVEIVAGNALFQGREVYELATNRFRRVEAISNWLRAPVSTIKAALFQTSVNVTNLTAMLCPLLWLVWRRDRWLILRWPLLMGVYLAVLFAFSVGKDLRSGYFLWTASLLIMASGWRFTWREQVKVLLVFAIVMLDWMPD